MKRVRQKCGLLLTAIAVAGIWSPSAAAQAGTQGQLNSAAGRLEIAAKNGNVRRFYLNHDEWRAYKKIKHAIESKNYAKAAAAIAAAEAKVEGADAVYAVAALKLELGLETGDVPLQNRAVEEVLASGAASKGNELKLQRRQGLGEIWEADYDAAEAVLQEYLERTPDKVDAIILLAETKYRANRHREALALLDQAIALETAAKRPIPARWLRARTSLMSSAPYEAAHGMTEKGG